MIFLYQTTDMNLIGEQLKIKGCKQKWLAEQKSFLQQNPSLAEGLKTEKKEIAGIN